MRKTVFGNSIFRSALENCIPSRSLLEFGDFNSCLRFIDYLPIEVEFKQINIPLICRTLGRDIELFIRIYDNISPLFQPRRRYPDVPPIQILTQITDPNEIMMNFELILQPDAIQKIYTCQVTEKCKKTFKRLDKFKEHCAVCEQSSTQKINGKQIAYGRETNCLRLLVNLGYLPVEALNFRKEFFCCFDIETLEDRSNLEEMRNVEAVNRLASISVSTTEDPGKVFVRENSSHEAAKTMVKNFVDYLIEIHEQQELLLPDYFESCYHQLDEDSNNPDIPKHHKMKLAGLKSKVKKYLMLDVFGFNSGKISHLNFIVNTRTKSIFFSRQKLGTFFK